MKVDAGLGHQLERVPASAKEVEAMGFDGVRTAEMNHDPFFPLLLAAEHTSKIELISSIAVGFARSPMLLANIGHDLNAYSKGRVTIGLGSQIYPARRELYVFGDPNTYVADWITAPYQNHVYECGGAKGQLVRIVPCLMDFSVVGIELDIAVSAQQQVEIEAVQSRARRIGERDFYRAEAPFLEVKFSVRAAVESVAVRLVEPAFGPLIWRGAALQENGGDKPGSGMQVSLALNGRRRQHSVALKYV